jgi:hypothetical protein
MQRVHMLEVPLCGRLVGSIAMARNFYLIPVRKFKATRGFGGTLVTSASYNGISIPSDCDPASLNWAEYKIRRHVVIAL